MLHGKSAPARAGVRSVTVSTERTGRYYLMKYAWCDVIL